MWVCRNGCAHSTTLAGIGYLNFTATRKAAPFFSKNLVTMEQIHGSAIHAVSADDIGKIMKKVDGLVVKPENSAENILLGISTADCVPVFGVNKKTGSYGAYHAGWRGIESGIIDNARESLAGKPGDLYFALGPHICSKCYGVGPEFAQKFPKSYSNGYMNLNKEIQARLLSKGVPEGNIDSAPEDEFCTFHNETLFYSYRRSGGPERMLSAIKIGTAPN